MSLFLDIPGRGAELSLLASAEEPATCVYAGSAFSQSSIMSFFVYTNQPVSSSVHFSWAFDADGTPSIPLDSTLRSPDPFSYTIFSSSICHPAFFLNRAYTRRFGGQERFGIYRDEPNHGVSHVSVNPRRAVDRAGPTSVSLPFFII